MRKTLQKILVLLLCVAFVVGILPLTASAKTVRQYNQGDLIEFGWYPQSKVTDSSIISKLNDKAPSWYDWTKYGYYFGWNETTKFGDARPNLAMYYTDILLDGVKYRGVEFEEYRPYITCLYPASQRSFQPQNGYFVNTVYWFRFDPLKWRVLNPSTGLLLCESVIDCQAFNNYAISIDYVHYGNEQKTFYANNYAESSIRKWLNDSFYNTAFTDKQKNIINLSYLNNENYAATSHIYDAKNTYDRIFLLSYSDVRDVENGFAHSDNEDRARVAMCTEYAKCQGVDQTIGYTDWNLRSAVHDAANTFHVNMYGEVTFSSQPNFCRGVRPSLKLLNNSEIIQPYSAGESTDEGTGVEIRYDSNTYEDKVTLSVTPLLSGSSVDKVKKVDCFFRATAYNIETYVDGSKTQPNKAVTLKIPIPDGYKTSCCKLFSIDTENPKECKATIENGSFVFTTDHLGAWAIVELKGVSSVSVSDISMDYKQSSLLKPSIQSYGNVKYTISYTTSNAKVAVADNSGKVSATGKGEAVITCKVSDDMGNIIEDTCKVSVKYTWWQQLIRILLFGWIWY